MKNRMPYFVVCVVVALGAVVWAASTEPRRPASRENWEYRIVSYSLLSGDRSLADVLERQSGGAGLSAAVEGLNNDVAYQMTGLGRDGWELVCFHDGLGFVFKRRAL